MIEELFLSTSKKTEFIDITAEVAVLVKESGVKDGLSVIFTPHTTAAITINENADPDAVSDMSMALDKIVPHHDKNYRHGEGNSAAHIKSSMFGCDQTILVKDGKLLLGVWQGIYFCEFDGPRNRTVHLTVTSTG